jgi:hypothetical protein
MSELQRRIEYILEGDDDIEDKAERITAMLERKDRHIAKLAKIGGDQEAEIAELRRRIEALEARPLVPVIVPSHPWPQPTYPQPAPYMPWSPYYPTITNGGTSCQSIPSMIV